MSEFFNFKENFDIDEELDKELDERLSEDQSNDKTTAYTPFSIEELMEMPNLNEQKEKNTSDLLDEIPDISDIKPLDDLYLNGMESYWYHSEEIEEKSRRTR